MRSKAVLWSGVFVLGLVLLLGTNPVWSQAVSTGTVTGNVMLPDGTPSPGTTVVLDGPTLVRGQWSTVADDRGKFVFLRVPPGTYKVTASLSGFNTQEVPDIAIASGSTVPVNFTLEIAAARGKGKSPGADTVFFLTDGRPTSGQIVDANQILAEISARNRLLGVTIHTIGVAREQNAAFLFNLAKRNHGEYASHK